VKGLLVPIFSRISSFVKGRVRREARDSELDDELRFHVEMIAQERIRQGASHEDAYREARLRFGGPEQVKERVREARTGAWLDSLLRDVRFALRTLRRNPGFTAVAIITLALGVGANTAIFSVVKAVLLQPFPYREPSRLAMIWGTKNLDVRRGINGDDLLRWGAQSRTMQSVGIFQIYPFSFSIGADQAATVNGAMVGTDAFGVLGARALLGRTFSEIEDEPGGEQSVILSYGLWQSRFGGDRNVAGQTILLNGKSYKALGVMPKNFFFPDQSIELWVPLTRATGVFGQVHGLARLKPGVTIAQAQAELDTLARQTEAGAPAASAGGVQPGIFPLYRIVVGKYETAMWTLLGAVTMLLLIGCANVSNLLVAHGVGREREFAVRASLGASRARIFRMLLAESLVLSLAAGASGILGAWCGVALLRGLRLADIPRFDQSRIDAGVLLFGLVVAGASGIVAGIAPAWRAAGADLLAAMQSGGAGSPSRGHGHVRDLIVTLEVGVALVLLVGAGLLINSFVRIVRTDWGFNPEHLLLVDAGFATHGTAPRSLQQNEQFTQDVESRISAIPGVTSVSMAMGVPIDYAYGHTNLAIDGRYVSNNWNAQVWSVSPDYFRTMGTTLLRGREFEASDDASSARVAVINRALAEKLWPGRGPVGLQFQTMKVKEAISKQLNLRQSGTRLSSAQARILDDPASYEADGATWTVIGETASVRSFGLDYGADPAMYLDYRQDASRSLPLVSNPKFVIRTSGDPAKIENTVREQVVAAGAGATINKLVPMSDLVLQSIGGRGSNRLMLVISILFGSLSLILAAAGIGGVVSFVVAQRTREFGIRRTLGAGAEKIFWLVLAKGLRPVVLGLCLGLAGAFAVTRLLKGLLFGVTPMDGLTLTGVTLLLLIVACAACVVPAWRAIQVEPVRALRYE
jgi:putative ABC transport system permease protein